MSRVAPAEAEDFDYHPFGLEGDRFDAGLERLEGKDSKRAYEIKDHVMLLIEQGENVVNVLNRGTLAIASALWCGGTDGSEFGRVCEGESLTAEPKHPGGRKPPLHYNDLTEFDRFMNSETKIQGTKAAISAFLNGRPWVRTALERKLRNENAPFKYLENRWKNRASRTV